jgi:sterol desaturase/sphingolipid hydroxylase (fatty acid hydroxylase superfamily)
MESIGQFITEYSPLSYWLVAFVVVGFAVAVYRGWFKARKIQPKGFKWKVFRDEFFFAIITLVVSATVLLWITKVGTEKGIIAFNSEPAAWWVIGLEYIAYFFLFDTWFYWLHRWMHKEPVYTWVHKIHHRSTSPNLLTTLSVNPLESLINGGFVPLFTAVFTIHSETMLLITPTNIIMGLYVHSGYEFLPRWWNKTWATKWFITATFHDQHHKYFRWNFGGYTTIWDRVCGTTRTNYESDFDQVTGRARASKVLEPAVAAQERSA